MSNVLVIAEHLDGELRKVTLSTITFAREAADLTGGDVFVLVLGKNVDNVVSAVKNADGVDHVYYVNNPIFTHYIAENYAPAICKFALDNDVKIVAAPASTMGKDLLPRVAAKLEAGMVSDAIMVFENDDVDDIVYKRPLWAGNVITTVQVSTPIHVVSVRASEFKLAELNSEAEVSDFDPEITASENAQFLSFEQVKSERPELTDASIIISGGRGLKSSENFNMIMELADAVHGAVGATRAAVDSGYAPNDWQIGQTGKIVAPDLYVATAISGAIQHLAGMKGSKTIVAINNDPEAPIFQVADYGLVADAFQAVPQLTKLIKES